MRPAVAIVVGVVAAFVVLWIILLVGLAVLHPGRATVREVRRIVPDTIRLTRRLAGDVSLGLDVRVRLWVLLVYLALPIDLVPDLIPVIGYADDAVVIGLVLRSVMRAAGPELVRHHWPGTDEGLAVLARLCRLPALRPGGAP
ncbi:MAG: YkvA family protein [Actinomycetota bacterium]|nr:YkvA family protein [Actinomycetota bacterium]